MKRASVICIVLLFGLLYGCNKQIKYSGTDVNGNTASDVIKKYYESLDEEDNDWKTFFIEDYNTESIKQQNISVIELLGCETVQDDCIRESDKKWVQEVQSEYYAYCFVQTSDRIICNEDGSLGNQNDEVNRYYSYTLVMETKESEWKIYDFGDPPYYIINE